MAQAAPARRAATTTRTRQPVPRRRPRASRHAPPPTGVTRVRAAVATAPSSFLDRMVHGQGWVVCIGVLLAGVVYLNVSVLELNAEIASKSERAAAVKRENSELRENLAQLGATEGIKRRARNKLGMVSPTAAEVRYLDADPIADARRAARELETMVARRNKVEIAPVATRTPVDPAPEPAPAPPGPG